MTNYEFDDEEYYASEDRGTPEQTAAAANYIYSGDVMANPKFEVENNKIYTIEELMQFLAQYDQPVIFYLDNVDYITMLPDVAGTFKRYVILEKVNIGHNSITYYYPDTNDRVTVNYDDFLLNGIKYGNIKLTYKGTNILERNYRTALQPVYN